MREQRLAAPWARGASMMRADSARVGDKVCHSGRGYQSHDYIIEGIETDRVGHLRFHSGDYTASHTYVPNECIWVTRAKASP